MRKTGKFMSLIMAVLLLFSLLPGFTGTAHAVIEGWSMGAVYDVTNPLTGQSARVGKVLNLHEVNGRTAYCIDPTVEEGSGYSEGSDYWENIRWNDPDRYELICRAIYCGYPSGISADSDSAYNRMLGRSYEKDSLNRSLSKTAQAATQIMVHHIILGVVELQGGECVQTEEGPFWGAGSDTLAEMYDDILACMNDVSAGGTAIPSFASRTPSEEGKIVLHYNPQDGSFSATATDTNGVLDQYPFEYLNEEGLRFSRSGNTLTVTADRDAVERLNLTGTYVTGGVSSETGGDFSDLGIVCWGPSGEGQTLCYYDSARGSAEPGTAYLALGVDTVPVSVRKTDAETDSGAPQGDAALAGAAVGVFREDGVLLSQGVTGEDGNAVVYGIPLGGSCFAQELIPPEGYLLNGEPAEFSGDPASGNAVAEIPETVLRGGISVQKTDAETGGARPQGDGSFGDIVFEIYNRSAAGVSVGGEWYEPGDRITEIRTDAGGYAETEHELLPYGTYLITEKEVPNGSGYVRNETWSAAVSVHPGPDENGTVYAATADNAVERGGIRIGKTDGESCEQEPQGDASLSGAEISVINRSENPVTVNGSSFEPGDTVLVLMTDGTGAASTDNGALPYGTYELRETAAPEGYLLNTEWSALVKVQAGGTMEDLTAAGDCVPDTVIRGSVAVQKRDSETGKPEPLGGASLEGAAFAIVNRSAHRILYGGRTVEPGEVVDVIRTDPNGIARTADRALPYGTYELTETEAPEGYRVNPEWSVLVEIREDGKEYLIDQENTVRDSVWRGDWSFVKVNGETMERIDRAVFRVTSKTTGESHIIVTDVNGEFSSTQNRMENTNGNDAAVDAEGNVDESLINPDRGVWFSGQTDPTAPLGERGAFPYDTYEIRELQTSANAGLTPVVFEVTVYRDGQNVHIGTVDDNAPPKIRTVLLDSDTQDHIANPEGMTVLTDRIEYSGTRGGTDYELEGILMDADTGEVLLSGGKPVTAEASFTASGTGGSAVLEYRLNAEGLAGKTAVSFVTLKRNGEAVYADENILNRDETVHFPKIGTSLCGENGTKELPAGQNINLIDRVSYENLIPDVSYVLKGRLTDRETGETVRDAEGNPAERELTFKPESGDGTVDMAFVLDTSAYSGRTIAAFERLTRNGVTVARHENPEDESQTLRIPEIGTTLLTEDRSHVAAASECITLTDTVTYQNLIPGSSYSVKGLLVDRETGREILDDQGSAVMSGTAFTPLTPDGTVEVSFRFSCESLCGRGIVAFEDLYGSSGLIVSHRDLNDEEQTVYIASIRTVLSDRGGEKEFAAEGAVTLVDTVTCSGVPEGETYILRAYLVDRETGEPLTDENGEAVTASQTFTAGETGESISVSFRKLSADGLEGRSLVAFEELYSGDRLIASHRDLDDKNQTVTFPKLRTAAEDSFGAHASSVSENTQITDTVYYFNLTPGETYTVTGNLVRKSNGKAIKDENGDRISSTAEFTAEEPDGCIKLDFLLDSTGLENDAAVVFERLYRNGRLVGKHEDLTDEDQTVHFPSIQTSAKTDGGSAAVVTEETETVVLTDTVSYRNLVPGDTYALSGTLMDRPDGGVIRGEDGEALVAAAEFTPDSTDGSTDVVFRVPFSRVEGKTLVVFENLLYGGNVIAVHRDLEDDAQTVTVPYLEKGRKYDAGGSGGLAGAEFLITDRGLTGSAEQVPLLDPQTVISGSGGYFFYAALPGHQYSIAETKAPDGYLPDRTEYIVDIASNGVPTGDLEIPNVRGGTVVITKTDAVTGEPLEGCGISIWKQTGSGRKEVFHQVTDRRGRIYFYTDGTGTFSFRETAARSGYYKNEEEYTFTIHEDLSVTGDTEITNVPYGTAVMKKQDPDGNPLEGAQVQFYDEYDRYLGQGISDGRGRVYFVSPGPGNYYFKEVKAPEGYQISSDRYHFRIASDYSITGTLTLVNGFREQGRGSVKTGDTQNPVLWAVIAAASGTAAGALGYVAVRKGRIKAKRQENREITGKEY